jgi:hypothetical protein
MPGPQGAEFKFSVLLVVVQEEDYKKIKKNH